MGICWARSSAGRIAPNPNKEGIHPKSSYFSNFHTAIKKQANAEESEGDAGCTTCTPEGGTLPPVAFRFP
jgi:hypothetical protein